MCFVSGDTFIHAPATRLSPHLWMIISDTDQCADKVLIVNFTSWNDNKDPACRVHSGEHPFVKHESCVSYRDARLVRVADLKKWESGTLITRKEPLAPTLLERIRSGAACSRFLKIKLRQFLDDQGLMY